MITKLLMAACLMLGPAATGHQLACHHHHGRHHHVCVQPGGPIIPGP